MMIGALAFSITSCTKTCEPGYEGSDCKTEVREKFIGAFQGDEICGTGNDNYTITIAKPGTEDVLKVTFTNVYNQALTAVGTVDGSSFTVESQTVAVGITVSGSGSVSGSNLTFTYSINDGTNANNCTFTGTKL